MKRLLSPGAAALWLLACATPQAPAAGFEARTLGADEVRADLALARRVLESVHPGYDRYTPRAELDAAWEDLAETLGEGATDVAVYLGVSRLLTAIRCDHTKAELPPALADHRKAAATHMPFRFRLYGDRMIITSATSASGLRRGDEVVALDEQSSADVVATLSTYLPVDGFTDHVRARALEDTGEFLGSGLDHFYPLHYGFADSVATTVRRGDGSEVTLRSALVTYADWQELPPPRPAAASNFDDAVSLRTVDGTPVLTVSTFVNYRRPANPDDVYGPLFRRLREEGARHLVVDLRSNGGGSDDAAVALLAYLLDEPFRLMRAKEVRLIRFGELRDHLWTWDPSVFERSPDDFERRPEGWYAMKPGLDPLTMGWTEPRPDRFRRDVSVLAGPANVSGSTLVLAHLKDRGRARIVGEATGGSAEGPTAGMIFFLTLPHSGARIRVPWMRQYTDIARFEPGLGVTPDVVVRDTLEDFLAGRDAALETALRRGR